MDDPKGLLNLVEAFFVSANQHAVEKIMAFFNDDAEFELVGLYRVEGKDQIRNVFEYDAGVHTKLAFSRFQIDGDTVKGCLIEKNDRLKAIGFKKLDLPICVLEFRGGRIQKFSAKADESAIKKIIEALQGFLPWVTENYPADRTRLFTSEGRFIYNRGNGERAVKLLKEWKKG
ncbi:MAG: nuclear transport factor 2 family protein [Deltaproteobacteria bacterium]|nr:nuclear transport factor 2 family protein [Deltaproteobacteria bacterium]